MEIEVVRSAYRKFKSYVYYDNSNLMLRQQVASFESTGDIDKKLEKLARKIEAYADEGEYWEGLLENIDSHHVVKKFSPLENGKGLITNIRSEEEFKVDRTNYFVNCPVELHICSAIWLFEFGYRFELKMEIEPFGNKLSLKKEGDDYVIADGLKSFKPYFTQYQLWRDKAVQEAKDLVDRDKNALIIGLDVKDYYHSIRIEIEKLHDELRGSQVIEEYSAICSIFQSVHDVYHEHIGNSLEEKGRILPIGLISSGVLANYYLDSLDSAFESKLRPDFYGRYVDDILLVTSCPKDQVVDSLESVAKQYLVDSGIFKVGKDPDSETDMYVMDREGFEKIGIQAEKLSVLHFSSEEPTALLDKFLAELKQNSSEYRLLPEDEVIEFDFDQAAYNLSYSGTGNKLRDIKEFGEDKFGISKYLAKKIFLALQSGHESDHEAVQKIVRFFKGRSAIELHSLWEKVFTFLLLNRDLKSISEVVRAILLSIDMIKKGKAKDWDRTDYYIDYLFASLSLAFSLKPSVLEEEKFISVLESIIEGSTSWNIYSFKTSINNLRVSNLVRHSYVVHPLLNYVGKSENEKFRDLIDYSTYFKLAKNSMKFDDSQYRYSPRFVHFHELSLFHIINRISEGTSKFYRQGFSFLPKNRMKNPSDYLDDAKVDFYKFNFQRSSKKTKLLEPMFKEVSASLYSLEAPRDNNNYVRAVKVDCDVGINSLRVGIANMEIDDDILKHQYLRKPFIKPIRRKKFNSILNQAESENVDLLVLPEVSVPVAWFKWISDHALRQQRAMVFGLEHWVVGNRVFNFIVTLMPFSFAGNKSLVVNIRLKNHYSPAEADMLKGYGYIIPEVETPTYDLFNWKGVHFTAFNCFELSNIEHRARFRSKIDLLIASEFNKDVNYFSNLVESSARDIHCYVAQANDSKYGDSRLTQPSSTTEKDLLKVKGGRNSVILVEDIDLEKLREFQIKEYLGQKRMGGFKPTPPDFDRDQVKKRMKR